VLEKGEAFEDLISSTLLGDRFAQQILIVFLSL